MSAVVRREPIAPAPWIGAALIVLCLSQWFFGWAPAALGELQRNAVYRVVTGLMLAGFIGAQWVVAYLRFTRRYPTATAQIPMHRWVGALLPALVFVHSEGVGHAYLAALSVIVLLLCTSGVAHPQHLRVHSKLWTRAWLPIHIVLSLLVVTLIVVHIVVVTLFH